MRRFLSFLTIIGMLCVSACAGPKEENGYRLVAAPGDVVAVAPVGNDAFALLGGNEDARNVTFERASDGSLIRRFGVTREAVAIAAAPGGVYLGLATPTGGAVELWGADGRKRRTIPMPGAVIGFASRGATSWALIHAGKAYAAIAVPAGVRGLPRAIPLPAETVSFAYCDGLKESAFVVSRRDSRITLVRVRDGATTDTADVGSEAVCSKANGAMFSISRAGVATYLNVIALRTLLTVRQVPTMDNAIALAVNAGGELIVLAKGDAGGAMRVYSPGSRDVKVPN